MATRVVKEIGREGGKEGERGGGGGGGGVDVGRFQVPSLSC